MSNLQSPLGTVLPNTWSLVRLATIATKIGSGATPTGGQEVYLPERLKFALVRSQNVYDGYFAFQNLAFINDEDASKLKSVWLESNDLLLNITGNGATFSRCCIVPDSVLPACVNQHVAIIRVNPNKCVPSFLLAYLNHPKIKHYIDQLNVGGSRRAITKSHIEGFIVPLPPLAEQQRIADIIDTWDEAIALVESLISALKLRKQGLMQRLLTGEVRFAGFDDPWQEVKLDQVVSQVTDYVANGSFADLRENVTVVDKPDYALYVRLTDLKLGLGHSSQKYVTKDSYEFLSKSNLYGEEILVANIGSIGEVIFMPKIDKHATIAPNMIVLRSNQDNIPAYLYYFLNSYLGQRNIFRVAGGSSHLKLNKTELKTINIVRPNLEEQAKIVDVMQISDLTISQLARYAGHLREQKKGLMQGLLTGSVRVGV